MVKIDDILNLMKFELLILLNKIRNEKKEIKNQFKSPVVFELIVAVSSSSSPSSSLVGTSVTIVVRFVDASTRIFCFFRYFARRFLNHTFRRKFYFVNNL